MSQELNYLSQQVALGRGSRRDFLGRAAALGLSAAAANALLATAAQAAGPRKGGTLKIGLQGGAATDSLDPALAAKSVQHALQLQARRQATAATVPTVARATARGATIATSNALAPESESTNALAP